MTLIIFLLGLIIGLAICFFREKRLNRQLKGILNSLSTNEGKTSLSTISKIRRQFSHLYLQRQQLEIKQQIADDLLEKLPMGYLLIDGENQLISCNHQARQLLKIDRWQPGKVRLMLELVRSLQLDRLVQDTRKSQQPQVKEWIYYSNSYLNEKKYEKDIYTICLKASSFPLPQGEVAIFIENKQPLLELSQSHDRLFSDLTHELRTPLTSISLVAEALEKRLENPERLWVEQMLQEIKRLMDLVQDWLSISQLKINPSQNLNFESIQLKDLILSIWQSLEVLAKQKELSLNYSGADGIEIIADRARLTQVFLNLFDNSIKHSPEKGEIKVEVKIIQEKSSTSLSNLSSIYVAIDIIDCGRGFDLKDLPYVFDRLYRGDSSRARNNLSDNSTCGGLGLGLAITKEIIQAHQGSIEARNHPETGGAWLILKIPKNIETITSNET